MLRKILIFLVILISIFSTITTIKISSKNKTIISNFNNYYNSINNKPEKNDIIGNLTIKKLNLNEPLFKIDSKENTVERHITILKESIFPDKENSIIFLAAHSGTGKIAYFEELDHLTINDEIIFTYKNKKYTYYVSNIWEEKKNGFINVNKEKENQLILTTCSPTKEDYQLIVNCKVKEL